MDSQSTLSVNCNHCGATLEVDENTRFVTCKYCHSSLAIQSTGTAVFTQVLEKLEAQTGQIAGNLKVIARQNELEQLDREWNLTREDLRVNGWKPPRELPIAVGGAGGMAVGIGGGLAWTIFAAYLKAPHFLVMVGVFLMGFGGFAGLGCVVKFFELDSKRAEYEGRRRQMVAEIEAEKCRPAI